MVNGWKVTAIIFIVLFILETILFGYSIKLGTDIVENENKCMINVCSSNSYDAYVYDSTTGICDCYKNGLILYEEYIG